MTKIPLLGYLFSAHTKASALQYLTPGERAALQAGFWAMAGVLVGSAVQIPQILATHSYNGLLGFGTMLLCAFIAGVQKYYSSHGDVLIGDVLKNLEAELQIQENKMVPAPSETPEMGSPLPTKQA